MSSFTFVDLFAGIGGFHAALEALGGECVYASEIDKDAARVYSANWGTEPSGDITLAANDSVMEVPAHDVLVGGFPCQPFSKSGKQRGMDEARGTLFWNIAKIIEVRKPRIVLLENVRNIAGPRHAHEWEVIIKTLRELGYRVSLVPLVASPHRIHPNFGGRPQVRERVFIAATLCGEQQDSSYDDPGVPSLGRFEQDWNIQKWNLSRDLPLQARLNSSEKRSSQLGESEMLWIRAWEDFLQMFRRSNPGLSLPGFPLWSDCWVVTKNLRIPRGTPAWKSNFLKKNAEFYTSNKKFIDIWLAKYDGLSAFPPSRRKFEWQAQDAESLNDTIMHFRPSGIRAKKATYVPALVAITQTSILGRKQRRITVREAARLQGLPDWFSFQNQTEGQSFKQLGNGVNVGVVYNVMKAVVERDVDLLGKRNKLVKAILGAADSPDGYLSSLAGK